MSSFWHTRDISNIEKWMIKKIVIALRKGKNFSITQNNRIKCLSLVKWPLSFSFFKFTHVFFHQINLFMYLSLAGDKYFKSGFPSLPFSSTLRQSVTRDCFPSFFYCTHNPIRYVDAWAAKEFSWWILSQSITFQCLHMMTSSVCTFWKIMLSKFFDEEENDRFQTNEKNWKKMRRENEKETEPAGRGKHFFFVDYDCIEMFTHFHLNKHWSESMIDWIDAQILWQHIFIINIFFYFLSI